MLQQHFHYLLTLIHQLYVIHNSLRVVLAMHVCRHESRRFNVKITENNQSLSKGCA